MSKIMRKVSTLSLVALSLVMWSCDNLGEVTQPLSSDEASFAKGGNSGQLKLIDSFESSISGSVTHYKVIGPEGGAVGDDAYRITVPKNAVGKNTLFVIGAASEHSGKIAVQATATSCESGDTEACYANVTNDVGTAGFRVPVRLDIGFNPGGGNSKWRGVTMVWIRPDGQLVRIPTHAMMAQKELRGLTDHFSDFGLAWP